MPGADVQMTGSPLVRLQPWYPGQFGVGGAWTDTGLRQHCTGTIFYVDPNYPGAHDGRDGTDPTAPLLTVGAAIARCQPYRGDVIVVMHNSQWYYAEGGQGIATAQYTTPIIEEVTVNVAGVRLIGLASSTLGVMWTPASNAGTCITVSAMDVIIEGFVFTEGTFTGCDAISAEWDGVTLFGENLTVRHCHFDDTVDTAIQLEYTWYCDIHDNYFQQCDLYGIHADVGGSGTAYSRIHDNLFQTCVTAAIALLAGSDDNWIYGNQIFGDGGGTNNFINLTAGARNLVSHNVMSCTLGAEYIATCSDGATDSWIHNYLENGVTVGNP